jgi:uncharacterized oxidoreductase
MNLKNNTILITGGTSGIGLEFAKQLLNLGNTVIITGRNQSKLDQTKKIYPALHIFNSDAGDAHAIANLHRQLLKEFPSINIIINNAGEMRKINLHNEQELENITREIEINLCGPIRLIQHFLPDLKKQKNAAIINVTSGLALVPFPISPIYGATKAALHSYTKSLRIQLKQTGIRVFDLLAPATKTPLNDKFQDDVDPKTLMAAGKLVTIAIQNIAADNFEIYPGAAKLLKIISKIAPGFLLKQLSKPVDKMLTLMVQK